MNELIEKLVDLNSVLQTSDCGLILNIYNDYRIRVKYFKLIPCFEFIITNRDRFDLYINIYKKRGENYWMNGGRRFIDAFKSNYDIINNPDFLREVDNLLLKYI